MQIGLPHLFAGLGALVILLQGRRGDEESRVRIRWALVGLLILLGAMLLCSQISQHLWEVLPLVKYVQFPWRFLGLAVFGATLCGTAVADRLSTAGPRAKQIVFLTGLVVVLAAYYPYYSQAHFLAGDARTGSVMPMTSAKVDALAAAGYLIPLGYAIKPADIRTAGERATSSDDFLPRDVQQKPTQPSAELVTAAGQPIDSLTQPGFNDYHFNVQMAAPGVVQLRQFWFPGWQATIDGLPATTAPAGPSALVSCPVPAGNHVVEFRCHAMPQRRTGFLVSLVAFALTGGAMIAARIGSTPLGRTET
jgi:hypothetical protein